VPDTLLNRQLTLSFFQDQIGADVIKLIRKITFCGNDGDPIYCRQFLEIIAWIKSVNPGIQLVIITNGSHKPAEWWSQLGIMLDHRDEINWSIDGWDQASNELYRVNSDWNSIMAGYRAFSSVNKHTYRVWAAIAFKFNQQQLDAMTTKANDYGFDLFQLTKSTKFGSHYPDTYGVDDPLCPDSADLVSASHRFERVVSRLSDKPRPGQDLKEIFWQRAQELDRHKQYSGICLIGNKGVFLNSQGEFYPCCWTATRYEHNRDWHDRAHRFNLNARTFTEIMQDDFWTAGFLQFDSLECQTKCTPERLADREHVTEW
jgi:MoaA/NifB/PqqE/SkfB family radical SAM enzyme